MHQLVIIYVFALTPPLVLRWATGDKGALSGSAAYPRAFGRAWVCAHECYLKGLDDNQMEGALRDFAYPMADGLPPVGQLAVEAC